MPQLAPTLLNAAISEAEVMDAPVCLYRFHNGRMVTFSVDRIIAIFDPYVEGFSAKPGLLDVRFDDDQEPVSIGLDADASTRRRTYQVEVHKPVDCIRLWDCLYRLMLDDSVVLACASAPGPLYASRSVLPHLPASLSCPSITPVLISSASDLRNQLR